MVSCGCPPPPLLLASPAGVGGVLCGLGRLAGCSVGCLAALGWRVPGALDTLSAACRGPLRAVAPRGLSSHLRDPLKPCAPGWPLHPLGGGPGSSPRSVRASHGAQPSAVTLGK